MNRLDTTCTWQATLGVTVHSLGLCQMCHCRCNRAPSWWFWWAYPARNWLKTVLREIPQPANSSAQQCPSDQQQQKLGLHESLVHRPQQDPVHTSVTCVSHNPQETLAPRHFHSCFPHLPSQHALPAGTCLKCRVPQQGRPAVLTQLRSCRLLPARSCSSCCCLDDHQQLPRVCEAALCGCDGLDHSVPG